MSKPEKKDPKDATPHESGYGGKKGEPRNPFAPPTPGQAKRGSELRDADLNDATVEDLDEHLPD
jgi:hypothetical protein